MNTLSFASSPEISRKIHASLGRFLVFPDLALPPDEARSLAFERTSIELSADGKIARYRKIEAIRAASLRYRGNRERSESRTSAIMFPPLLSPLTGPRSTANLARFNNNQRDKRA